MLFSVSKTIIGKSEFSCKPKGVGFFSGISLPENAISGKRSKTKGCLQIGKHPTNYVLRGMMVQGYLAPKAMAHVHYP